MKQLGWIYSLIVTSAILILLIILFNGENNFNKAYLISGISAFLVIGIHINRGDKFFILSITNKPYLVFFTEYLTISLITISYFLINKYFLQILPLITCIILLSILPIEIFSKTKKKVFTSWPVNEKDFEWISGLRKSSYVLLFIYLLAIVSLSVPFLSLLFAWYLAVSLCSFYKEAEPLNVLLSNEKTVNSFLLSKVVAHQINYWKFIMPIVLIYGLLYQEHLMIVILFIVFVFLGLCFAVINKYSTYESQSQSGNDILNALVFGAVLIPFLVPLPIVLLLRSIIKANRKLKEYFEK